MAGWHQTIIIGNLGRDPEMRYLPSGTAVCNMNIAVGESWTDRQSNERREKTTWYHVAVFGAQAENCAKYLAKGRQVMVIGTVEASAYTNNAGEAAASLELRAREVRFLGSGSGGEGGGNYSGGGEGGRNFNDDFDSGPPPSDMGDIPF